MKEILTRIDRLIDLLKQKGDVQGYSFEDSKAILCLEILRLELVDFAEVKDTHFGAVGSIIGWSHHYYQIDHSDIFEEFQYLDQIIEKHNFNPHKGDIESVFGNDIDGWVQYIANSSRELFERKTDMNK
jgi:hypothetical protein